MNKKAPNTIILGEPRYSPIVELKGWVGKTIRRVEPVLFTDDATCTLPVGSEVKLISIDDQKMVVCNEKGCSYLNLHFWADGRWELVG